MDFFSSFFFSFSTTPPLCLPGQCSVHFCLGALPGFSCHQAVTSGLAFMSSEFYGEHVLRAEENSLTLALFLQSLTLGGLIMEHCRSC